MKSEMRRTSLGHSGWEATRAFGMFGAGGGEAAGGKSRVDDASALPDLHILPAGLLLHVVAEIDIGQEEDGLFGGDGIYNCDGVAGGTEDVAFGFDLDGSVDIADDHVIGISAAEGSDAFGGAAIDQAAAGVNIGQDDGALGIEDFGGLGHEFHAAEDDSVAGELLGDAGELEAVADVIGGFLNFGVLIVVGQDGGFSLSFQVEDFFGQGGGGEHGKRPAN